MRTRMIVVSAVLASVALVLSPAPAQADARTFEDRSNDARRGLDIREVRVVNSDRVIVRAKFDFVARRKPRGWTVYYDTRPGDRGPEFMSSGGLREDTDWLVSRIESWRDRSPQILNRCDSDMRIRFGGRGRSTFDVAARCFNRPGAVRVAVRSLSRGGGGDWAPRQYRLYGSVDRSRLAG